MKLPTFLRVIKEKIQLKKFRNGYWDGYSSGAKRCLIEDGRFLRLSVTDMNVYCEFKKHPNKSRTWLYGPWRAGFDFGYTEAVSFYNSGDHPHDNNDTVHDQEFRIMQEFLRQKDDF